MRRYRKWVLTLGLMAAAPSVVQADLQFPWSSKGKAPAAANNQKTAETIAAALQEARLSGQDVDIHFKDGVCTLSGKVTDPNEKVKADRVCRQVPGVRQVNNQLMLVAAPAPSGVQTAGHEQAPGALAPIRQTSLEQPQPAPPEGLANQRIAEQIGAAFSRAQLTAYEMEIQVHKGQAVLLGMVGSPEHKAQASQLAMSVPGIQTVDNQLQVAPAAMPQPEAFAAAFQNGEPLPPGIPPAGAAGADAAGPGALPPAYPGAMPPAYPGAMPPAYPGAMPGYPGAAGAVPGAPGMPMVPPAYTHPGAGLNPAIYNMPNLPPHGWPTYAAYPNSAAISYPTQYSASAWPYIGPFYPYPQVPLGWRKATLEWDDGYWALNFRPRTDRWWWFFNPENW